MQPKGIDPDLVCRQAIQAKMAVYKEKEQFEAILKVYNDQLDNLIHLTGLMKNRIVELEGERRQTGAEEPTSREQEPVNA